MPTDDRNEIKLDVKEFLDNFERASRDFNLTPNQRKNIGLFVFGVAKGNEWGKCEDKMEVVAI